MTPEQRFYTYLHCRPDGVPFYVGKGAGDRSHRFTGRNRHHQNIVAKHGAENIGVFVFPCASEDEAFADEIQQIAQLRADGYRLVNQTNGGDGVSGRLASQETRAILSTKKLGNKSALGSKGGNTSGLNFLGKHHSQESKAKISATKKGKPWTEARRIHQTRSAACL